MLRAMFIHRPTFIYNVLSPLSARQDGFHWRTWWKTPVSLFSHLFRIFKHPFQCLHACLPSPHLRWRPSQDWEEHLDKRCDITDRWLKISNIEYWTNPWKGNFQWGPQCRRGWRQREAFRAGGRGSRQAPIRSFLTSSDFLNHPLSRASMCHLYKLYNATSIKVLSSQLWD